VLIHKFFRAFSQVKHWCMCKPKWQWFQNKTATARVSPATWLLACVASIPEWCERNSGPAKEVFAFGPREKWGECKKVEGAGWGRGKKVPHFCSRLIFCAARMQKNSFARAQFRSRGTGTLATQATWLYVAGYSGHNGLLVTNNLGVASYL